ncbi:ADP-glucose pyrophosphorylase family protein isoform 3 [Hibiscus syriacus]|uniref:ADP-glucose pyrophosphorylase family protein isoform 3 n=1 Tax=Hibiscus syriacus TaxID=106335 RepID=A0A6A3BYU0_HIBSY|nr:ADP-glucose pyrophosphorylase family protein isoform 3 [Hibiscus syriacus]
MEEYPSHIFLLNCDVCCIFPLTDMLEAHKRYGGMGTVFLLKQQISLVSWLLITKELLHYTEKPETFVSDLINCGVYIFIPDIFTAIQEVSTHREDQANFCHLSTFDTLQSLKRAFPLDFVRSDQDILSPFAGKKQLYTYETMDFWEQIKTPGMSLKCSGLYLSQFRLTSADLLAGGDGRAGVRLINCIVFDDVEVQENAVVINSIVGWKSSIGKWSRANGDYNAKLGITILGEAVIVEDEVVVIHSIVLPNKTLNSSVQDEIIL